MRRAAALVVAVVGCGGGVTVAPVVDLPVSGSSADPRPSVDEIELSVARAGSPTPLVAATFTRGQTLVLDQVPLEDDLIIHMIGRSAGLEVAYGRTCTFDLSSGEPPAALHLWFSRTVHWAEVAGPARARTEGMAWMAADGGLAQAGGTGAGGALTEVEHFDPRASAWSDAAIATARTGGVVGALGDGRGVLAGGRDGTGARVTSFEVVDVFAAAGARVDATVDPRLALDGLATATLESGDVVIAGGLSDAGPVGQIVVLEVGEGGTVSARQLGAQLAVPRSHHTLTRLSDAVGAPVVAIGGLDAAGQPVAAAELYRPLREDLSPGFSADLIVPRSRHAAVAMVDGSVLVVGGVDAAGQAVPTVELFTVDGGFRAVAELPAGVGLIDATLTPLPDGRVMLAGGRATAGGAPVAIARVIRLDPLDGTIDVAITDDLARARASHAAGRLCDGTILVVGGEPSGAGAERYQPPSLARR